MSISDESESRRPSQRRASLAVGCAMLLASCALVVSLAALALVLAGRAQEPSQSPTSPPPTSPSSLPSGSEKNFTHLVFKFGSTRIEKGGTTMSKELHWWNHNVEGTIRSPIFEYLSPSRLGIKFDGLYTIYAQVNISHELPKHEEEVDINLTIHGHRGKQSFRIVTIPLSHPATTHTKETAITALMNVSSYQLKENDKLSVELMASNSYKSWSLSPKGNFFGVSRIPEELSGNA